MELARIDQADQWRQVVELSKGSEWSVETALSITGTTDIPALIARIEARNVPLSEAEPDGKGPHSGKLELVLITIYNLIKPGAPTEEVASFAGSLRLALSDMPGPVLIKAAQKALHTPMQFANEVHGTVRGHANEIMQGHWRTLSRLTELKLAQREAQLRANALPAPVRVLDDAEVARMAGTTLGRKLLDIGLGLGAVTQAQMEAIVLPREQGGEAGDIIDATTDNLAREEDLDDL